MTLWPWTLPCVTWLHKAGTGSFNNTGSAIISALEHSFFSAKYLALIKPVFFPYRVSHSMFHRWISVCWSRCLTPVLELQLGEQTWCSGYWKFSNPRRLKHVNTLNFLLLTERASFQRCQTVVNKQSLMNLIWTLASQ